MIDSDGDIPHPLPLLQSATTASTTSSADTIINRTRCLTQHLLGNSSFR